MAKLPHFPFYVSDWLGSRKVLLMTDAQRGIYITLLAHQWSDPSCSIPTEKALLQKMLPGSKWKNIEYVLRECFVVVGNDEERARNDRLNVEQAKALAKSEKAKEAVKIREIYRKQSSNDEQTMNGRSSPHIHIQNHIHKESKERPARAPYELPEWIDRLTWDAYEEMRKKKKAPMTDRARELIIAKLKELHDTKGHDPNKILEQSIEKSWTGVFELSGGNGNGKTSGGFKSRAERREEELRERHPELYQGAGERTDN